MRTSSATNQIVHSRVPVSRGSKTAVTSIIPICYMAHLSVNALESLTTGQLKHSGSSGVHWQSLLSGQLRQRMTSIVFASFASSSDLDMSSKAGAPAVWNDQVLKACKENSSANFGLQTDGSAALAPEPPATVLHSQVKHVSSMTDRSTFICWSHETLQSWLWDGAQ